MAKLQVKPYGVFVFLTIVLIALGGAQPPSFIITEPSVVGWKGDDIKLPCNFSGDPYAVFWVKLNGSDLNNKENKAGFFNGDFKSFDERFEMKKDFTLYIRELQVSDEGNYLCQLERADKSGDDKSTHLSVYAKAGKPAIDQCDGSTECIFRAPPDSQSFTLDCKVTGFKPNLTALVWSTAGRDLIPVKDYQNRLTDGTLERRVTITAKAKNGTYQNFTCTATGVAVGGLALNTITIFPLQEPSRMGGGAIAGIIISVIVVIIVGLVVWKSRGKGERGAIDSADGKTEPSRQDLLEREKVYKEQEKLNADIAELRRKIKEYKPGKAADVPITAYYVSKVNINLFGLMGAGKSSFFNSLNFAVKGFFEEISPEGSRAGSAKTKDRTQTFLGDCVRLNDNRGLQSFQTSFMEDVDDQVRGKRGVDPTVKVKQDPQNEIHCVIFVYEYNQHNWNDAFFTFIDKFFTDTFYYYGRYPLFVFTHGHSIGSTREELVSKLSHYSVPEENVRVFENYTTHNRTEDKVKSLQFLEFIWKALIHCDHNINHVDRKRREQPVEQEVQQSAFQKFLGFFGY